MPKPIEEIDFDFATDIVVSAYVDSGITDMREILRQAEGTATLFLIMGPPHTAEVLARVAATLRRRLAH